MMKRRVKDEGSALLFRRKGIEKILFILVFVIFAVYAISLVFPFIWLIVNSLQDKLTYQLNAITGEAFALPEKLDFSNYEFAFSKLESGGTNIFGMFFNSIWYTVFIAGGGILACSCTGYILAKYHFKASDVVYSVIIFTMTIPIVGTTGATFRLANDLGVYNTPFFAAMISLTGYGMNFLVLYGFFRNVSKSYAEAAFIDGASHLQVFLKVMLPQAFPIMTTLAIVSSISAWNDYNTVLLYMPSFPTIASGMFSVSRTLPRAGNTPAYYAALVISILPVMIVYISFSDTIMKNFSVGGLKG